eukprot:1152901-Pelagomonas_calceolata.AAC.24
MSRSARKNIVAVDRPAFPELLFYLLCNVLNSSSQTTFGMQMKSYGSLACSVAGLWAEGRGCYGLSAYTVMSLGERVQTGGGKFAAGLYCGLCRLGCGLYSIASCPTENTVAQVAVHVVCFKLREFASHVCPDACIPCEYEW